MVVHAERERAADLSRGQCRRERARHLQGPRHPAQRSAQAGRGLSARLGRDGRPPLLHLYPRRVLQRGAAAAGGDRRGLWRRADRQGCLRLGLSVRALSASRRRRLYLRRGNRPPRKPRRAQGPAAPEAAVSGAGRALRLPDHGQQRRDHRRRADHPAPGCGLVRRHRPAEEQRHQDLSASPAT